MSDKNFSTLEYRSNLYPIDDTPNGRAVFEKSVRDPFALKDMHRCKRPFSEIQQHEYENVSIPCVYAAAGDFPWGTVRHEDGTEHVVCKCLNIGCKIFPECRPDFKEDELLVFEENKKHAEQAARFSDSVEIATQEASKGSENSARSMLGKFDAEFTPPPSDVTEDVASPAHSSEPCQVHVNVSTSVPDLLLLTPVHAPAQTAGQAPIPVKTTVQELATEPKPVAVPYKATQKLDASPKNMNCHTHNTGFESFSIIDQCTVINAPISDRMVINAGPGTGKTWALTEKLMYMLESFGTDPQGILVLCFSRAAVEVITQRINEAAKNKHIGYDMEQIDIRTFDSFATYVIAWIQENHTDLLPGNYHLDSQDYDSRIQTAITMLKKADNILSQYKHLIVDEVQDLVGCRAELVLQILSILPENCGFTLSGDACQGIYDWLADNNHAFMTSDKFYRQLFNNFPQIKYFSFEENHRQIGALSALSMPYRKAVLTGDVKDRVEAAKNIGNAIHKSSIKIQNAEPNDFDDYIKNGTLGILTRTNAQALRISAWLKGKIEHVLQRPASETCYSDWLAMFFTEYNNDSINEEMFASVFTRVFNISEPKIIHNYWLSLIETQYKHQPGRYTVEDLLRGVLLYGRNKLLFTTSSCCTSKIVISSIHRAKGREFDSVLVPSDLIDSIASPDEDSSEYSQDELLEHKICYVAITRPRTQLSSVKMNKLYIYKDKSAHRRCFASGVKKNHLFLSHVEVGCPGDLDLNAMAADSKIQAYINTALKKDTRLRLLKCPEENSDFVKYKIVPEEEESTVLGYTGRSLAESITRAIQRIYKNYSKIHHKYYPDALNEVYVDNIMTCISVSANPAAAKRFGSASIWTGFSVSGFAQCEKDRY